MLRPIDGAEVSEEEMKALEPKPEEESEPGSEPSKETPEAEGAEKKEAVQPDGEGKVPFHQNPEVQSYIARQVANGLGETKAEFAERLDKLEKLLTQGKQGDEPSVFGGLSLKGNDATIAKAIILQAKRELYEDLKKTDDESREQMHQEDQKLLGWLDELKTTNVTKSDDDVKEVVRLLAKYGKNRDDEEDKALVLELFEQTRETREAAKAEGKEEGEKEGIKKAQEAKIGSGRKGKEIGEQERTYQQRRLQDRSIDEIVAQEVDKIRSGVV